LNNLFPLKLFFYFNKLKKDLVTSADIIVGTRNNNAYGRPFGDIYYRGCNGTVARQTLILNPANMLSENKDYINTVLDAIGDLFGRNYYYRSYVTGLGFNLPKHPHDKCSVGDETEVPWSGYFIETGHTVTDWMDKEPDYSRNEIVINWNEPLFLMCQLLCNKPGEKL
jgi:endoglucanase